MVLLFCEYPLSIHFLWFQPVKLKYYKLYSVILLCSLQSPESSKQRTCQTVSQCAFQIRAERARKWFTISVILPPLLGIAPLCFQCKPPMSLLFSYPLTHPPYPQPLSAFSVKGWNWLFAWVSLFGGRREGNAEWILSLNYTLHKKSRREWDTDLL